MQRLPLFVCQSVCLLVCVLLVAHTFAQHVQDVLPPAHRFGGLDFGCSAGVFTNASSPQNTEEMAQRLWVGGGMKSEVLCG